MWFAFTEMQGLDSGMECPKCGKHAEIVVADGVSIGYSSAKFRQGLYPPTTINASSPQVSTATLTGPPRAAIPFPKLREELRKLVAPKIPPHLYTLPPHLSPLIPEVSAFVLYFTSLTVPILRSAVRELLTQVRHFAWVSFMYASYRFVL